MESSVRDHPLTAASAAEALAKRFGGGTVARLAAEKALRSRQASAESSSNSVANGASESGHSGAQQNGSRFGGGKLALPEQQQRQRPGDDDEALLLSGLLNATTATQGDVRQPARLLLPHGQAAAAAEAGGEGDVEACDVSALPEGSSAVLRESLSEHNSSSNGAEVSPAVAPDGAANLSPAAVQAGQERRAPPHQPCEHSPPRSFMAAAEEEDTVLTGSPVGSPAGSGRSSPAGAQPARETSPAAAAACPETAQFLVHQLIQTGPVVHSHKPLSPAKPPREALRQQQWSFATIPQGTACIPSKSSCGRRASGGSWADRRPASDAAEVSPRPAFYTRAASPLPRPTSMAPARAPSRAPASSSTGGNAAGASAAQHRRQRLERLAQPKHSAASQRRTQPRGSQGAGDASGQDSAEVRGDTSAGSQQETLREPALQAQGLEHIAAWRPQQAKAALAAQRQREDSSGAGGGGCSDSSKQRQWPNNLGRELDPEELQRATGAYSDERFECHLSQLSARLAARQAKRMQAADAMVTGVDELVARVHALGTGTCMDTHAGTAFGTQAAQSVASGGAHGCAPAAKAWQQQDQEQQEQQGQHGQQGQLGADFPVSGKAGQPLPKCCSSPGQSQMEQPGLGTLPHSPTERLVQCRAVLRSRRPQTAPQARTSSGGGQAWQQERPATGSPARVKPLMQVKGEQDWAIQQMRLGLGSPGRPFRASPLPLSTVEPRYQREVEQREQRRQAAHEQRRQQLLAQQEPFGFEERAAERHERRLLLQSSRRNAAASAAAAGDAAAAGRPVTPCVLKAQPAPVSTTEARYALLVAEMQLQGRTVQGRRLTSPPRRPATATTVPYSPAKRHCPATAPAAHETGWAAAGAEANEGAALQSLEHAGSSALGSSSAVADAGWDAAEAETACETTASSRLGQPHAGSQAGSQLQRQEPEIAQGSAQPTGTSSCSPPQLLPVQGDSCLAPAAAVSPLPPSPANIPKEQADHGSQAAGSPGTAAPLQAAGSPGVAALPLAAALHEAQTQQPLGSAVGSGAGASPVTVRLGSRACSADGSTSPEDLQHGVGVPAWGGSVSCNCSSRAQARPASCRPSPGSPTRATAGIAVPVCIMPACRAAMAAAGAELLASGELPAEDAAAHEPWQAAGFAARGNATCEERRDTPPQHIAARYRQAEAAARREVQKLLQKHGSSVVSLMQQCDNQAWPSQ